MESDLSDDVGVAHVGGEACVSEHHAGVELAVAVEVGHQVAGVGLRVVQEHVLDARARVQVLGSDQSRRDGGDRRIGLPVVARRASYRHVDGVVDPVPVGDRVGGAARQAGGALGEDEEVFARTADQGVAAEAAGQEVVAAAARQVVQPRTPVEVVMTETAVEVVRVQTAAQIIVAVATLDRVEVRAAIDVVAPLESIDEVVAEICLDVVRGNRAVDVVV